MPKERIHFPETLPGAAKFSGDVSLNDPVLVVHAFKEASWISDPLIAQAEALESPYGRRRMKGSWALVVVAWLASRQTDIQPFYDRASAEMWRECGFEAAPSYSTTHARLTELESLYPQFQEATGRMIRQYSELEPRIGRHIHIDGTEAETHSRAIHDCQDGDHCAWRRPGESADDVNRRVLGRASTESAQKRRQQEDAGEADEAEESVEEVSRPRHDASGRRGSRYRVQTGNHFWLTRDPDAGFRSYARPNGWESWHGYYHERAVDDFTGLTIYGHVASSSRPEQSQYMEILRETIRALNPPETCRALEHDSLSLSDALAGINARLPEAIAADRGFAYPFIYEQNTRLGIATVMPWRKMNGRDLTENTFENKDGTRFTVDRHGIVHCKHCGGPAKLEEFRRAKGETPRLYVRCNLPSAPDSPCRKLQSVPCDLDWRMLLPLARNDHRYLALEPRFQFERAHHIGRVRNRTGAKDPILRPKRVGQAWQQLRLSAGNMLDWFRAGLKHGWIEPTTFRGYPKRVINSMREAEQRLKEQVATRAERLRLERQTAGLDTCLLPPEPEPPPPKPGV